MGKITYEFIIDTGEVFSFDIDPNQSKNTGQTCKEGSSSWTSLSYHKCENCPLKPEDHPHCPVSLDIEEVAQNFSALLSWKKAEVWVHTEERSYHKNCDLQTGLRSMLGLIMALSMCPILSQLKPLKAFMAQKLLSQQMKIYCKNALHCRQHLLSCEHNFS